LAINPFLALRTEGKMIKSGSGSGLCTWRTLPQPQVGSAGPRRQESRLSSSSQLSQHQITSASSPHGKAVFAQAKG